MVAFIPCGVMELGRVHMHLVNARSVLRGTKPEVGFVRRVEGHELLVESGEALPHIPKCMKAIEGELRRLVLDNFDQVKPFSRHQ
ncbi:tRNA methyltransferase 2, partial [Perkinsus olseni]